jgi:hypothetical protein
MRMKSKSTLSAPSKARTEFKGKPAAVKRAEKMDDKSDKAIAKRTGTKYTGR